MRWSATRRGWRRSRSCTAVRPSKSLADAARLAVAGVGASLAIGGERGRIVPAWHSLTLARGEVVQILLGPDSVCAYLAVEGGIAVPSVLGSASTYVRAALGGFEGRASAAGRPGAVGDRAGGGAGRAAGGVRRRRQRLTSRSG